MIPLMSFFPISMNYGPISQATMTGCISCIMHEEKNYISGGEYYLDIEYSMQGDYNNNIYIGTVIYAKNPSFEENQMFVVTSITKGFESMSIHADHISILLSKKACKWLNTGSITDFFRYANTDWNQVETWTTKFVFLVEGTAPTGNMTQKVPVTYQQMLGGAEGSILDVFGGDFVFDNLKVIWKSKRGTDNNYHINYGLNMLDFAQDLSYGNVTLRLIGYVTKQDGTVVQSSTPYDYDIEIYGIRPFAFDKILDLSNEFENSDNVTTDAIYNYLIDYQRKHASEFGNLDMSLDVDMIDVYNGSKYSDFRFMSSLNIGDIVHVYMPRFNIAQTSVFKNEVVSSVDLTCRSIEYDVLNERITNIGLGNPKLKMIDAIVSVNDKQKISVK